VLYNRGGYFAGVVFVPEEFKLKQLETIEAYGTAEVPEE
jgi:hypothetical protein